MASRKVHVDYDMLGNKVTGLATPSSASDAVTKSFMETSISGAVGQGLILIEEVTVGVGGVASWTSAAIPAGYRDLLILVEGRCEGAVVSDDISLRFNGDTGANYDSQSVVFNSAAFFARAAAATSSPFGWLTGANGGVNNASRTALNIYNYAGTTFYKGYTSNSNLIQGSAIGDIWSRISSGQWRSLSAITTVTMFAAGGSDIAEGTTIRIYGVIVGAASQATLVETSIATASTRGKFTITNAAITTSKKVRVWQAPGPYTGKGTRADEAEMQPVRVTAVESLNGSAVVYWETPPLMAMQPLPGGLFQNVRLGKVRGNVKFLYQVGN